MPENPELMDSVDLELELKACGFIHDEDAELWWLPHPIKEGEAIAVIKDERFNNDPQANIVQAARRAAMRLELIDVNERRKQVLAEQKGIDRRVIG